MRIINIVSMTHPSGKMNLAHGGVTAFVCHGVLKRMDSKVRLQCPNVKDAFNITPG